MFKFYSYAFITFKTLLLTFFLNLKTVTSFPIFFFLIETLIIETIIFRRQTLGITKAMIPKKIKINEVKPIIISCGPGKGS